MFERYNHLLIPDSPDFVPSPNSVAVMFEMLGRVGGAPQRASFRLGTLTGGMRKGRNPYTGEVIELPRRDYRQITGFSELPECLAGLDDYDLFLEGNGPADLPPFLLLDAVKEDRFTQVYGYSICLRLRKERVRLDETPPVHTYMPPESRTARFRHPMTGTRVEVANASSARFWIALEFGRWVMPKIADSLAILDLTLLETFSQSLGVGLAQGCSTY